MIRGGRRAAAAAGLLLATAALAPVVAAQEGGWRVSAAAGENWFSGGVRDTAEAALSYSLRPATAWSLGVDHALGRIRLGVGASYFSTRFQVIGGDYTLTDETYAFRQWAVSLLATIPVARVGAHGALALAAGPVLGFWNITDSEGRTTFGGLASLQLDTPLSARWTLLTSASGTAAGSPLLAEEVPSDFERTTLWTWQVGVGARYAP
jgi:hypothetical protein